MRADLEKRLNNKFWWYMKSDAYCECGDGWYQLIDDMLTEIQELCIMEWLKAPQIGQIKEKYGSLRVYMHNYCEDIEEVIARYERKSSSVCELCGKIGTNINYNGWQITRCEECCK